MPRNTRFFLLLAGTSLALAVSAWATVLWHLGVLRGWDWQEVYLTALAWAFVFWNSVRIFTYVPSLRLLLKAGASAEHYSVASWASWVLSNGTLALYLFEAGGRNLNSLVLLNSGNTLMCLITCALIVSLRWRHRSESAMPAAPDPHVMAPAGDLRQNERGVRALFIVGQAS